MTTKLIVAPFEWENGCVKRKCQREKGKGKEVLISHFQFQTNIESGK